MPKPLWLPVALSATLFYTAPLFAAEIAQPGAQQRPQKTRVGEQIYGSQLMTQEERNAYRAKMRGAKTQAERDQIRADHHAAMQERAKEKGLTLPDQPRRPRQARGKGKGAGPGANR